MDVHEFVQHVRDTCKIHGVKLELLNAKSVDVSGTICSGYFNERDRKLVVTIDKPQQTWLGVLAHEFCHLKQWASNSIHWSNCYDTCLGKDIDCINIIDLWLSHNVELNDEQIEKYINHTISVEKECEINTVELIKQFDLPIDIRQYIKEANAYLLFYQAVRHYRKWCVRPSNENIKVMEQMKDEFKHHYYEQLSPKLLEDFRWCFFEE
jgi:hypothetical protein